MKTTGAESNSGNERVGSKNLSRFFQDHFLPLQITAERERQELATELARQVEENKRLRKSLLAQSTKFLSLRQSSNNVDLSASTTIDHRLTPVREYAIEKEIDRFLCSSRYLHHNQCRIPVELPNRNLLD